MARVVGRLHSILSRVVDSQRQLCIIHSSMKEYSRRIDCWLPISHARSVSSHARSVSSTAPVQEVDAPEGVAEDKERVMEEIVGDGVDPVMEENACPAVGEHWKRSVQQELMSVRLQNHMFDCHRLGCVSLRYGQQVYRAFNGEIHACM